MIRDTINFFSRLCIRVKWWLDLKDQTSKPIFYTIDQPLIENTNYQDEAMNITRMGMGANGKGYAITNDGSNVISFTKGKKSCYY